MKPHLIALVLGITLGISSAQSETAQSQPKGLTPLQHAVTQKGDTEPPFKNEYWDNKRAGLYVDLISGEPLFSSLDKYDSGTGWPSFSKPINSRALTKEPDTSLAYESRVAVRSSSGAHLGHVFNDGPGPDQSRYCVNSASLRFIPLENLEAEGYGKYKELFTKEKGDMSATTSNEKIIIAGGCFWGMEDLLRKIPGVVSTRVGYSGGTTQAPTYDDVSTGKTGHAESVEVVFDPKVINLKELLGYFFRMHDPTTPNRQGNDVGTQYRSAIFYFSDAQRKIAEEAKIEAASAGRWHLPVTTQVVAAGAFTAAEEYHQDYLQKHPGGYTCHYLRD